MSSLQDEPDSFTAIRAPHVNTIIDPAQAAVYAARARKDATRIAAARAKAEARQRDNDEKVERKQAQAAKKAQKLLEDEAQARLRSDDREWQKEEARRHRNDTRARRASEKERKIYMGGVAWGFDATAGSILASTPQHSGEDSHLLNNDASTKTAGSRADHGGDQIDDLNQGTSPKRAGDAAWGVEHGGPGKQGQYGYGSLKSVKSTRGGTYDHQSPHWAKE